VTVAELIGACVSSLAFGFLVGRGIKTVRQFLDLI